MAGCSLSLEDDAPVFDIKTGEAVTPSSITNITLVSAEEDKDKPENDKVFIKKKGGDNVLQMNLKDFISGHNKIHMHTVDKDTIKHNFENSSPVTE